MATIRGYSKFFKKSISTKAVIAEFVGSLVFILVGTASCVWTLEMSHGLSMGVSLLIISLAFGVSLTAMVYSLGHISGGQFNPAVTVGLVFAGYLPIMQGAFNIAAQLAGSVAASTTLFFMMPHKLARVSELGMNGIPPGSSIHGAFIAEAVGTCILMFVILETALSSKGKAGNAAPIAIGGTVFVLILVFFGFSSGCFNPARAFGPAFVSLKHIHMLALYTVAPIAGALGAVPLHLMFVSDWDTTSDEPDDVETAAAREQFANRMHQAEHGVHQVGERARGMLVPLMHNGDASQLEVDVEEKPDDVVAADAEEAESAV